MLGTQKSRKGRSRHEIWDDGYTSKGATVRHNAVARTPMTSPSNLPSQHSAPTSGPTRPRPPRLRCRVRSALRLRPSAEAPHGRSATTLRRGFVPVGRRRDCGGGGAGPARSPRSSIRARAPGKATFGRSRVSLKRGVHRVRLRRVFEVHPTEHWHSFEHPSLTAPKLTIPSRPRLIIRSTS